MIELWYYNPGIFDVEDHTRKSLLDEEVVSTDAQRSMDKHGNPGFSIYFFNTTDEV